MLLQALVLMILAAMPQPNPGTCATVPASVVARAGLHVFSVAQMLVEARCSVGIELRLQDYTSFPTSVWRWIPWQLNRQQFDADRRVRVIELVSAFNAQQDDYFADAQSGIVVIRPRTGRSRYLGSRPLQGRIEARGLSLMHATLAAAIEGRPRPRAVAGSFLGAIGVEIDRGENVDFSILTDGKTVLEILNDVVQQAAPRGWVVTTFDKGPDLIQKVAARIERLGFIYQFIYQFGSTSWMSVTAH